MIKMKRILCPTDLSTESDEALRYAVALACAYEAKLVLLHCSTTENHVNKQVAHTDRLFTESLAPHLGLANLCDLNWEGVVVEDVSNVGKEIVQQAEVQKVDLIVMRSRRRPRAAVLVGSTAETVSRSAPCPVLVTHPREREWVGRTTGEIDLHRILVACDFSPDSELALQYGFSMAQEYQAEVHMLHVLGKEGRDEPELSWTTATTGSAYKFVAQKMQQTIPKEVFLWSKVVNAVKCGTAHQEILAYAKENAIDLIFMGASGGAWTWGRLLGSNVDRVLRDAPCPVFIARPLKS